MYKKKFFIVPVVAFFALTLGAFASFSKVAATPENVMGSISGSFQVDGQGAAHYTVPIMAPPGTMGMSPSVSLVYNSHSPYGFLGAGWTISGFSSITRCSIRRYVKNDNGDKKLEFYPVNYDANDRFCMDGQYLRNEAGSVYGADGAVYHPENSPWTKVESIGTCGSGPCAFKVTRKDGLIRHYGGEANAKILAVAGEGASIPADSVRVWAQAKTLDVNGNAMEFQYLDEGGAYVPHKILYTSNAERGNTLKHQRAVQLFYDTVADTEPYYNKPDFQGGAIIKKNKLLKTIKTCIAEDEITGCEDESVTGFSHIFSYELEYDVSPVTKRKRLTHITHKDAEGNYFSPTVFTYQSQEENKFSAVEGWTTEFGWKNGWDHSTYQARSVADINGDGRYDMIGFGSTKTVFALSDGEKFVTQNKQSMFSKEQGYDSIEKTLRMMGDVNADGKQDIIGFGYNYIQVGVSGGEKFKDTENWSQKLTYNNGRWDNLQNIRTIADINGDGRSDIVGFGTTMLHVLFSEGDKFSEPKSYDKWFTKQDGYDSVRYFPRMTGDVNGDGRSDIVGFRKDGEVQVGLSHSDGIDEPVTWTNDFKALEGDKSWDPGKNPRYVQDVNGDGMADLVGFTNNHVIVAFSTGKSFTKPTAWTSEFTYNNGGWDDDKGTMRVMGDINGDRLADIIAFGNHDLRFGVSTGMKFDDSLYQEIKDEFGYESISHNPRFPADVNGNGVVSIVGIGDSRVIVATAPKLKADLLSSVTNGFGGETAMNYVSIASQEGKKYYHIEDDVEHSYPLKLYNAPMDVVSDYSFGDGRGNDYDYEYHYSTALVDLLERGFLGFRSSTMINKQINPEAGEKAGLATEVLNHQDYPLHGMPKYKRIYRVEDEKLTSEYSFEYEYPEIFVDIFNPRLKRSETTHHSIVSDNSYKTAASYEYDDYGNERIVRYERNTETDKDDYAMCGVYKNDPVLWRLGYPLDTIEAKSCQWVEESGCSCDQIFSRSQTYYTDDNRLNIGYDRAWNNEKENWLGSTYLQDNYGNVTHQKSAYWAKDNNTSTPTESYDESKITYDSTYHTFVAGAENAYYSSGSAFDARFNTLIRTTDPNGAETHYHYDLFGREKEIVVKNLYDQTKDVVFAKKEYSKDAAGQYVKAMDRLDWGQDVFSWEKHYVDGMGRSFRTEMAAADDCVITSLQEYYSLSKLQKSSLPHYQNAEGKTCAVAEEAKWTNYEYDSVGNVLKTILPDGNITHFMNDIEKLDEVYRDKVVQKDAYGTEDEKEIVSYLDDRQALLRRVFPPLEAGGNKPHSDYDYDAIGRMLSSSAPKGIYTKFVYDSLGSVLHEESQAQGKTSYEHDDKGYLHKVTDALDQTIEYEYDGIGRVTVQTAKDASGGTTIYKYFYDQQDHGYGKARLTSVKDETNGIHHNYFYDLYGNLKKSAVHIDGEDFEVSGVFDALGREMDTTYPDGSVERLGFDVSGFLRHSAICKNEQGVDCSDAGNFTTYAGYEDYTAMGKPQTVKYLEGNVSSGKYVYDAMGRIDTFTLSSPQYTDPLIKQKYYWNHLNLLTKIEDLQDSSLTRHFEFYKNSSLKSIKLGEAESQTYQYDEAGNILKKGELGLSYDVARQIEGVIGGDKIFEATFNDIGNMKHRFVDHKAVDRKVDWDFVYDPYNNLIKSDRTIKDGDDTTTSRDEYTYDYMGNVVKRHADGVTSYYLFSNYERALLPGDKKVDTKYVDGASGVVAAISVGDDTSSSRSKAKVDEHLKPGENGAGIPVAGKTLFFHSDLTNNNTVTLDESGKIDARVAYEPYGEIIEDKSTGTDNFRPKFAGNELFAELELYNLGARLYDPFMGRFTTADGHMLGGDDTHIAAYNRYAYASNNPIDYVDPSGHSFLSILFYIKTAIDVVTMNIPSLVADVGAYMGASAVNHSYNPEDWDAKSAKTYLGIAAGVAISEVAAAISVAAPELIPEEAGFFATLMAGVAAEATAGFIENAGYAALAGSSFEESMRQGLIGAAIGGASAGALGVAGKAVGMAARRIGSGARRVAKGAEEVGEEMAEMGTKMCRRFSFPAGTPVHTTQGIIPIEQVTLDHKLVARPDGDVHAENNIQPIEKVFSRTADEIVYISFADGKTIKTTTEHPFYVENSGWREAKDLGVGDSVITIDSDALAITAYEIKLEKTPVYNFEVANDKSFFVGLDGIWVHNSECSGKMARQRYNAAGGKAGTGMDFAEWKRGFELQHIIPGAIAKKRGMYKKFRTLINDGNENGIMLVSGRKGAKKISKKHTKATRGVKHIKKGWAHPEYNKTVEKFIISKHPSKSGWTKTIIMDIIASLRKAHMMKGAEKHFADDIVFGGGKFSYSK